MSYSNFKDPLGLFSRILFSGNKTAYFTLLREGMSLLLRPVDTLWKKSEQKKIRNPKPSNLPLIIILGGSRSGTTILYQMLANYLPVSYFNNLSVSFPQSPISSAQFFKPFFRKTKNPQFNNYYGSVSGFNGPNDGFHVWNRWFGQDRNSILASLPPETVRDMQRFFNAWHESMGKPFLNKNNRNSFCVDIFREAFDRIHFIEIRRNPLYVVQSLIQSREVVQGNKNIGWGLGTKENSNSSEEFGYIKDICEQVKAVEKTLDEARSRVPSNQYTFFTYEDFCSDPATILSSLYKKIWPIDAPEIRFEGIGPLKNTNYQKLEDREFKMILKNLQGTYAPNQFEKIISSI